MAVFGGYDRGAWLSLAVVDVERECIGQHFSTFQHILVHFGGIYIFLLTSVASSKSVRILIQLNNNIELTVFIEK